MGLLKKRWDITNCVQGGFWKRLLIAQRAKNVQCKDVDIAHQQRVETNNYDYRVLGKPKHITKYNPKSVIKVTVVRHSTSFHRNIYTHTCIL